MCGLAGIVGSYHQAEIGLAIRRATNAQFHRGPDDGAVEVIPTGTGAVALGSRRLAILDLTQLGHQPMIDPESGSVLAYNGEIYNYSELRSELSTKGHRFSGRGDTEVLLLGYREWGHEVLEKIRGMFAFALWDAPRERLLVARDHLGIKPLYYATTDQGFLCASELKALLAAGLFAPTLDRRGLAGFLAYGAVQEPLTIVEQVRALPAGSWMEVSKDGRIAGNRRYWDYPEIREPAGSEDELIEQGRALLQASVTRHLTSDVPVGVFLSSGVDSTAVGGLAALAADHEVQAFNVSFPEHHSMDEGPAAARTAQRLGLVFHDIAVDSATALRWATEGLGVMDQPSMDGLNTYIVARAVHEAGLKVALSGQGGDEVFGGYPSFRMVPRLSRWSESARRIPLPLRRALVATLARGRGETRASKIRDLASASDLTDVYLTYRRMLSDSDMGRLGFSASGLGLTPGFQTSQETLLPDDPLAAVGRLESRFYLGNTLLRDADVFGMASSLEIRVPMLDRDLVDWAFSLPGPVLLPPGSQSKHLLRRICATELGADQLAPKRGFALPLAEWMGGPLAELRREGLDALCASGLLAAEGVRELEARYLAAPAEGAWTRVWGLVALSAWLEAHPGISRSPA